MLLFAIDGARYDVYVDQRTEVGLTFHPFNIHINVQFVFWCVSYTDIRRGERGHVLESVSEEGGRI